MKGERVKGECQWDGATTSMVGAGIYSDVVPSEARQ